MYATRDDVLIRCLLCIVPRKSCVSYVIRRSKTCCGAPLGHAARPPWRACSSRARPRTHGLTLRPPWVRKLRLPPHAPCPCPPAESAYQIGFLARTGEAAGQSALAFSISGEAAGQSRAHTPRHVRRLCSRARVTRSGAAGRPACGPTRQSMARPRVTKHRPQQAEQDGTARLRAVGPCAPWPRRAGPGGTSPGSWRGRLRGGRGRRRTRDRGPGRRWRAGLGSR